MTYIDDVAREIERRLAPARRPKAHAQDLYRIYALLVLSRGESVTLANVHDAWSTWMSTWDPGHRALRPFDELSPDIQREDQPYLDAIRAAARDRVLQRT